MTSLSCPQAAPGRPRTGRPRTRRAAFRKLTTAATISGLGDGAGVLLAVSLTPSPRALVQSRALAIGAVPPSEA